MAAQGAPATLVNFMEHEPDTDNTFVIGPGEDGHMEAGLRAAMARAGIPQHALDSFGAVTPCSELSEATYSLSTGTGAQGAAFLHDVGGGAADISTAVGAYAGRIGVVHKFRTTVPVRTRTDQPVGLPSDAQTRANVATLGRAHRSYPDTWAAISKRMGTSAVTGYDDRRLSVHVLSDMAASQRLQDRTLTIRGLRIHAFC